jgi:hypothetical protein
MYPSKGADKEKTMTLRHLIHRKAHAPVATVEELQTRIDGLTTERQRLRASSAELGELESNRREIAAAQWQLSYALIQRYLPRAA